MEVLDRADEEATVGLVDTERTRIEARALIIIADTLRTGVIPADLRAALYQAAALIPASPSWTNKQR